MIKLVPRLTNRACSLIMLAKHLDYLVDGDHPDHKDKILGTPKNYNCADDTAEALISEVARSEAEYQKHRAGRRGKRTKRIFEEIIYSSPYFADMTDEELDIAEEMVVKALVPDVPARSNRHKCKKKRRTDFHIIFPTKTGYPPSTTIWGQFGGGKACIFSAFDILDDQIAKRINEHREKDRHIKSRIQVRREKAIAAKSKKPTLAEEIAAANPARHITAENIRAAIEALGHAVTKETAQFISIVFKGARKPRRYNLPDLITGIEAAQEIRRETPILPTPAPTTAHTLDIPATPTSPAVAAPTTPALPRVRRRRPRLPPPPLPPLR